MQDRLATLSACLHESETESDQSQQGHLMYVESLLRMRSVQHLSGSQQEMRELLLDLLLVYANGRSNQSFDTTQGPFVCAATYILYRTGAADLAAKLCESKNIHALSPEDRAKFDQWIQASGIDIQEWKLIQPNIAGLGESEPTPASSEGVHPSFSHLIHASRNWISDYLTWVFIGTRNTIQWAGLDIQATQAIRSLNLNAVLGTHPNADAASEEVKAVSHFPKVTFSRSF